MLEQTQNVSDERLSSVEAHLRDITLSADKISASQRNELVNRVKESIEKAAEGSLLMKFENLYGKIKLSKNDI